MLLLKYILVVGLLCLNFIAFSQSDGVVSSKISDCEGATNILEPGDFTIQFTGNSGLYNDVIGYPSLNSFCEKNSIWLTFIAPFDGFINLKAELALGGLQMVIFQEGINGDICEQIHDAEAEIIRLSKNLEAKYIGLNKNPNQSNNELYSISLNEGEKISILFNTIERSREVLRLNFDYEPKNKNDVKLKPQFKVVDFREDEFSQSIHIVVRDATTGEPVIASLTVEGSKNLTGLYVGSDFYFVSDRMAHMIMKCDAKGYFFIDKEEKIQAGQSAELTFWLEPLLQGKSLKLEDIEFQPGSSEFLPSAIPKLKRLKDFLVLNAEIKIEIQGHVYSPKDFSPVGQVMSEARAKRVYNYLVDNGIDKKRLIAVGYGNKHPVFPNPKFDYEEQMNRRVEIKIIE